MRLANRRQRATLLVGGGAVDLAAASDGAFGPDVQALYGRWDELRAWVAEASPSVLVPVPYHPAELGPPVPRPGQVFAIGLNYRDHADEVAVAPAEGGPSVFTKFPGCLAGPVGEVRLPAGGTTDWEAELVVVVGRTCRAVAEADAWDHVAGLTVGQDLSERTLQLAGALPQFSLGKSFPGFGPIGPAVVTPDELADPDDLAIACWVDGAEVQADRTSRLRFGVPALLAAISAVTPLHPGDLVFTGTPGGVGHARVPPRYLRAGEHLRTAIEGLGELHQTVVGP